MRLLKQNIATTVLLGPFVQYDDAVTPKTTLTLNEITAAICKGASRTGITLTASGGDNDFVHVADGYWSLELTVGNLDTAGQCRLTLRDDDVFLPVWEDFEVLPGQVYDSMVGGSDKLQVQVAADGLDNVSVGAPAGVAGNFREMVVQLWRRFFKKSTMTATQLKTYADNDSDVLTTQAVSDNGATQTQGAAS